MGKEYEAARPLDIGSDEIDEDRSTEDHKVAKVLHYEEGEVVDGAEDFPNLKGLVDNGYLREKAGSSKAGGEAKPARKSAARKSTARRSPRT